MVSLDALAFVRFGLRAADDVRIVNTVKVVDAILEVDTPRGRAWRRYQGDQYGEHADGSPFDGTGVGRAWPLLTGERAHYELAAGRPLVAMDLARTIEAFAGESGLIPEQIWDSADLPGHDLYMGQASGSAMPLAWAHAEYLKLCRSLEDGEIFDRPPQTVQRYLVEATSSSRVSWRFNNKVRVMAQGRTLRVETLAGAVVHWSVNGWRTAQDDATRDTMIGVHLVDLETSHLRSGDCVEFTFFWPAAKRWEGVDFAVHIE
jgi:glucoamylase